MQSDQVISQTVPETQEIAQELPVVRENYQEDIAVEEMEVDTPSPAPETPAPVEEAVEEKEVESPAPVEEETTAPPADEAEAAQEIAMDENENDDTPPGSPERAESAEVASEEAPVDSLEKEMAEADADFADLFPEDEDAVEEDGPTGETATGSDEAPKASSTVDSAVQDKYDPDVAQAAKEKARRHAQDADGAKTTAIVEATTDLVNEGEEVVMDDLDWLNEEDQDYTFEDLFPEMEEEMALEDGSAPALAIQDEAAAEEPKEEVKTNAFEEGLERLKRKRGNDEMTPQQAEERIENLIFKMTTAADEDGEIIRKNMAKERLHMMCEKAALATKKNLPYLGKKEHNMRFQRLYKHAQFPEGKAALKSYFDQDEKFVPAKALAGTKSLLNKYSAEPALKKVSILKYCCNEINKPTNQSWFVTFGGLSVLRTWLQPSPDGTLPALSLRTEVLRTLEKLPITQTNLRKSKLGHTIKELMKREDETLNNRKVCQDLVNRWLALVLDQETSIRRYRADEQHRKAEIAQPVAKKRKTKKQIKDENKEIQDRRHPQMFQKPSHNFTVAPAYEVKRRDNGAHLRQTRKGKIGKVAGELRALRPATKHEHVSISGNTINLTF